MAEDIVYTFETKTGLSVRVRPLRADDVPLLVDLFEHLGPESRFQRFNRALDAPSVEEVWDEAQHIARIEPSQGEGWLAFADLPGERDAIVAGVRYVRIPPNAAEAAIVVRDDIQKQGVGRHLLQLLIREVHARGIKKLTALVRQDNPALSHLLPQFPYPVKRLPQGQFVYLELGLDSKDEG
ncbi:MAG: GNAT family N-acetyltransferase [Chloroflexota bacterium]|nr:GNAT family N-acetyltransferase [Chloroflexota bacterium]